MKTFFKCMNCGEIIREDEVKTIVINSEPPFYEYGASCPVCGEIDLDTMQTCPVCGKAYDDVEKEVCPECAGRIRETFSMYMAIIFDDRYGQNGEPGTNKEAVEAILAELGNLVDDEDLRKQAERREVK